MQMISLIIYISSLFIARSKDWMFNLENKCFVKSKKDYFFLLSTEYSLSSLVFIILTVLYHKTTEVPIVFKIQYEGKKQPLILLSFILTTINRQAYFIVHHCPYRTLPTLCTYPERVNKKGGFLECIITLITLIMCLII